MEGHDSPLANKMEAIIKRNTTLVFITNNLFNPKHCDNLLALNNNCDQTKIKQGAGAKNGHFFVSLWNSIYPQ